MLSTARTALPRLTRDEKKAQTRLQLLEVAATVFARRGYHAANVDEVAEEAGYSVGALYSNFSGKQDLFLAMLEDHFDRQMAVYNEIASRGGTIEEKARGAADHWITFLETNPQFFPLFIEFWGLALRDPGLGRQLSAKIRSFRDSVADLMRRDAAELGIELPADAAESLATAINGMGNGLALYMLADPKSVPRELFGDVLTLLFEALRQVAATGQVPQTAAAQPRRAVRRRKR
jgi:AcrR family transcriptional regulator